MKDYATENLKIDAVLVKTTFWLDGNRGGTTYWSDDVDRGHLVTLDERVWEDLGRPETITVTIKPGHDFSD